MSAIVATDITEPNNDWGMCGFMSVLTALYEQNRLPGPVMKGHMKTRLLAEVKSYLLELEDRNAALFKEIDRFQAKFGAVPLKTFIENVRSMGSQHLGDDPNSYVGKNATVAMTVEGLLDYLNSWCKVPAKTTPKTDHYPGIIGLTNDAGDLRHWVYRYDKDNIFNYGKQTTLNSVLGQKDPKRGRNIGFVIIW